MLELMIGVVILVVSLTALIAAYSGCFVLNESARNLTVATNHAQAVMEEIRNLNIPDNITQRDWKAWAQADPPAGGGCNTLENESVTVTYPSGTSSEPLEVLVTVSWTERGRNKSVQVANLISER